MIFLLHCIQKSLSARKEKLKRLKKEHRCLQFWYKLVELHRSENRKAKNYEIHPDYVNFHCRGFNCFISVDGGNRINFNYWDNHEWVSTQLDTYKIYVKEINEGKALSKMRICFKGSENSQSIDVEEDAWLYIFLFLQNRCKKKVFEFRGKVN